MKECIRMLLHNNGTLFLFLLSRLYVNMQIFEYLLNFELWSNSWISFNIDSLTLGQLITCFWLFFLLEFNSLFTIIETMAFRLSYHINQFNYMNMSNDIEMRPLLSLALALSHLTEGVLMCLALCCFAPSIHTNNLSHTHIYMYQQLRLITMITVVHSQFR